MQSSSPRQVDCLWTTSPPADIYRECDYFSATGGNAGVTMAAPVKKRMTQEERRALTREKLIHATITEIAEKGYANLTTKGITKRSGVTWGAAQHLFGDRDNLVFEVARAASEKHIEKLKAFDGAGDKEARVRRLISHMWEAYHSPEMEAYYEISVGTRNDKAMAARLRPFFSELVSLYDQMWQQILSDFGQPLDRIAQIRQLVILTLSGLARREVFLPEPETVRRVIELLEELVTYALSVPQE